MWEALLVDQEQPAPDHMHAQRRMQSLRLGSADTDHLRGEGAFRFRIVEADSVKSTMPRVEEPPAYYGTRTRAKERPFLYCMQDRVVFGHKRPEIGCTSEEHLRNGEGWGEQLDDENG